ncbi:MAG: DEAD/DEAH box helicase, partial [candidate division WOR-3 bacterium]
HQTELLAIARSGRNAIITSGTASGKTLAFNLPVIEALARHPAATALYLYPLKAVTENQRQVLLDIEKASGIHLAPAVYDGDTPRNRRPQIRQESRIVLSNPYEFHQVLPYHYQWQRFLAGLAYLVIDEAHQYRGVFGSHVAQLIRRLRRVLARYGAQPRFILASASIANPLELAQRLTGLDFILVSSDGSPRGRCWLALFNPLVDQDTPVTLQVSRLVAALGRAGLQTLCFVDSRNLAELIARNLKQQAPDIPVSPYRAGYLAADRRRIEAELACGRLRCVVSTSALELGIDVGGLDAIVIYGWPGTLASFWQRAGRAGRKLQDSVVIYVARESVLEQFLIRHQELIFSREFESAVVDLANPHIIKPHLCCAASESPLQDSEIDHNQQLLLSELARDRLVQRTPAGWVYTGRDRPQEKLQLESIGSGTVAVICEDRVLETVDRNRALRTLFPGAVLLHLAETYLVKSLDLAAGRAEVVPAEASYRTEPIQHEEVAIVESIASRRISADTTLSLGRLQVTERIIGFRTLKADTPVSLHSLDLPPIEFSTVGLWLTFGAAGSSDSPDGGTLHAAEHALIGLAPLVAMCDRFDLGGFSSALFPGTGLPTIIIYDGYEGGIGIAEKLYVQFSRLSRITSELLRDCPCENGCPACVLSVRCGNNNQPMDKHGAARLLKRLAAAES